MKTCAACSQPAVVDAAWCPWCGAALAGTTGVATMLVDGRYRVESALGHGSQGSVYLARDIGLGRRVALKLIKPEYALDEVFVKRFKREAAALASVRSEHVVQVHAFGPYQGSYFFAMEYVRGVNLQAIVEEHTRRGDRLPLHRALTVLRQVARGIDAIHAAGIIHRDVKPGNVMIEDDTGRPVLVDLGLALWCDPASEHIASNVGTPAYMAPEQIMGTSGGAIAPCTDVYALGCSAFQILTGALPFVALTPMETMYQHVYQEPARLSEKVPALAPLDAVLSRCLARRGEDRYATCEEFVAALDAAAAPLLRPRATPRAPSPIPSQRTSLRLLVVDDDEAFCEFAAEACRLALPLCELELVVCESGVEALQAASQASPDVVVLDRDMPLLDGFETLSYLREMQGARHAEVFVASVDMTRVERWRFASLGVTKFLEKPVSLKEMIAAVGQAAKRALARRQLPGGTGGAAT